jgi:hypothetical protein
VRVCGRVRVLDLFLNKWWWPECILSGDMQSRFTCKLHLHQYRGVDSMPVTINILVPRNEVLCDDHDNDREQSCLQLYKSDSRS